MSYRTVVCVKLLALALLLTLAPAAWFADIRSSAESLLSRTHLGMAPTVYCAVVLLSFVGLSMTPFLRDTVIRCAFLGVFLAGYALDRLVLDVSGFHAELDVVRTLWRDRSMAIEALTAYRSEILQNVALSVALGVALGWPFPRGLRNMFALVPGAALGFVALHFWWFAATVEGYPSPFAIPARLVWTWSEPPADDSLPLEPVKSAPVTKTLFEKIVFIVDESVRGDYLTINDERITTTPYLTTSPNRPINFGIAISGANCSFQSRWMLRRGVRPWQLPDRIPASGPPAWIHAGGPRSSLWQFAKAAGFKTVYVDAGDRAVSFHSGLTREERTLIDNHVVVGDQDRYRRDPQAARTLVSILRGHERTFIYTDKFGVHFPFDACSPPDFNRFTRPDGSRFPYNPNNHEDLVGSYKNAVTWSVDEFFRQLLGQANLTNTLVVYTSDHGQNLWDGGYKWGHCSGPQAHPSEVWVPLFAIAGDDEFSTALRRSAERAIDQATHFEIFPTLLLAMGYDATWVTDAYGPSLLSIPADRPRGFLVGDVLGRGPRFWIDVGPPRSHTTSQ